MRTIAFKQANHANSRVADSLPADWITEFTYVDLHADGFLKTEDGWQFLPENEFEQLKNKCNHPDNLKKYKDEQDAKRLAEWQGWSV